MAGDGSVPNCMYVDNTLICGNNYKNVPQDLWTQTEEHDFFFGFRPNCHSAFIPVCQMKLKFTSSVWYLSDGCFWDDFSSSK